MSEREAATARLAALIEDYYNDNGCDWRGLPADAEGEK